MRARAVRAGRREVGVGIIGLGYMGRTHLAAYRAAARAGHPNRVIALCDERPERFQSGSGSPRGNLEPADSTRLDPGAAALMRDPEELLGDAAVELVSICTPTDTHVPLALRALEAGKHVLVEKPIALSARAVQELAGAARRADRSCMPAMCMRFWPGWEWLKRAIDSLELGRVRSAVFRRLASRPGWSDFYRDPRRSGGALFDLHVHDADFVLWCFGMPGSLVCTGTIDHLTASYRFEQGPAHVTAEGGWDHADGTPFHMGFTVVFERATADFAFGRDPRLLLARDGRSRPVELDEISGYDGEIRHALDVAAGTAAPGVTVEDALLLARVLEAERESLATGAPVAL